MLLRLVPGEIFGEISFLDAGDAGAATSVHAEGEVRVRASLADPCQSKTLGTAAPVLLRASGLAGGAQF